MSQIDDTSLKLKIGELETLMISTRNFVESLECPEYQKTLNNWKEDNSPENLTRLMISIDLCRLASKIVFVHKGEKIVSEEELAYGAIMRIYHKLREGDSKIIESLYFDSDDTAIFIMKSDAQFDKDFPHDPTYPDGRQYNASFRHRWWTAIRFDMDTNYRYLNKNVANI